MAIFRVAKDELPFTQITNELLEDKRLSLKAVGLLCFMLRQKNDWTFSLEWLAKQHKDGVDSVSSGIRELEKAGYIQRQRLHKPDGTFGETAYIVHERPQTAPTPENPVLVNPAPIPEKPVLGKPGQENPGPSNTIQPNTIPPIVPPAADAAAPPEGEQGVSPKRRRRRREPKPQPDWMPERFAAFWSAYPRGESKQAAIAAWDSLKPDEELLRVMAHALKRQLLSKAWQDGIGIPYASTWLNQRRWEDEERLQPTKDAPAVPHEHNGGYDLWT